MKTLKSILILILFVTAFVACTGIYEDGHELASDVGRQVEQISVDQLKSTMEDGGDYVLIDVRQPVEHYTASIDGSVLMPRGIIEKNIGDEDFWMEQYMYPPMKDSTEIIVYCKSGARSILAVKSLMELGYKDVKGLKGGYDAFNPNQDPDAKPEASSGCGG